MKATTIYERKGKLYVHSSSQTVSGIWLINAPVLSVNKDEISKLGHSIRECLDASREGVPHPVSFSHLFEPVLALAGVKSFGTFVKSAKCVEVETGDGKTVTLVPTRNLGVDEGFAPLATRMEAPLDQDHALGSAAIAALAMSEA